MPAKFRNSRSARARKTYAPRFALTGTPGTGKSSVARRLAAKGLRTISLHDEMRARRLIPPGSPKPAPVDPAHLRRLRIEADVVEGHLSHFLPARRTIVLRCEPARLERRLLRRGEPKRKARENAEAEALGIVAAEAREEHRTVFEVDTSGRSIQEVVSDVLRIISGRGRSFRRRLDLSEGVLAWF
ncbi:MAG TPA: AAA family ATPase [Thermoplasmata archaeon]|nr:AAA family ATPase [Thermoplasmata archaeon]